MHRSDEFNDGIAQKLETFVVLDLGFGFEFLSEARHDVDEHINTSFSTALEMNPLVAILGPTNAAIRQRVSSVIRIRSKVFFVRRMCHRQLKEVAKREKRQLFSTRFKFTINYLPILKDISDGLLKVIQRPV